MKAGTGVVFLPCSDIGKTIIFYHSILGLPIAERQSEKLCILDTGYGYWGFCQYDDGRQLLSGPHGVCLSLNLESEGAVQMKYEQLKNQCPVYSFFHLDPDGYLVEYQKTDLIK